MVRPFLKSTIQQHYARASEGRAPGLLLLTGHLNRSPAQVEDAALRGTFLFEPATTSLGDASFQFEAQVVSVIDGFTDLHIEHRGAGPALELPRGKVLGELRQLGATRVHMSHREAVSCNVSNVSEAPHDGCKLET